jgi:PST family polysaccharide transporter
MASACAAAVILGTACSAFFLLAPPALRGILFGADAPQLALVALAGAAPFVGLAAVESAVVRGLRAVGLLASANVIAAILGLLLLIPLVFVFGLSGALVHITLFSLIVYLSNLWARRQACRTAGFGVTPMARPRLTEFGSLASYGSANAISTIANNASLVFVRTLVINLLGVSQNGIYQIVWVVPTQALNLVFNPLSAYAFPHISGLKTWRETSTAINTSLRFALLMTTPLVTGLILMSQPLVLALYSPSFLPAAGYLQLQLLGDFPRTVALVVGLSMVARGHLRAFTGLYLLFNVVFSVGALVLLPRFGLWGAVGSYVLANTVHATATYLYQRRLEGFRLTAENVRLLGGSVVLLLGAITIAWTGSFPGEIGYGAVGLAVWSLIVTSQGERAEVWVALHSFARQRRAAWS